MRARRRLAIVTALSFAGLDLLVKGSLESILRHERPAVVIALSGVLALAAVTVVPRFPSHVVSVASGIAAGGAVGNAISGLMWSGGVPDPLVISLGGTAIAFNLADVFALGGTSLMLAAAAVYVLRHPGSLRRPV